MDRLISLEPSNVVLIRIEQSQKCYGELTLRNVMHTMPVAFWLQPMNKMLYKISPQSGIISPLTTVTIEIIYESNLNSVLPESFPYSDDSFLLHSTVVPGAVNKVSSSTFDSISSDWFTTKKKQVFTDSGVKVMFAGSLVLAQLIKNGAMEEIRDVLEKCDPSWKAANSVDSDGQTLLHLTINQSRPDLAQLLLEFDPDIEAKNGSGSTPLETATASRETLIVELLLARGANVERSESCNYGPIHFASGDGNIEILKLLLFKNANVNALTKDGSTALHIAVEERHKECVKLLLASGAKPDIRNVVDGDTPLHIATALGDEHMVKLLLQKGANKDIRNRVGKTAYDIALNNGHNRLFDALRLGESLSIAARKGEVRTIQRLLEYGASINGRDQRGWTALHRASFKGQLETVRALIQKGIEIDGKDEDGYSALHCAVESGHVDIVELLVKKGADLEGRTSKGVSAIQIAETLHYSGITRVLINGGATSEGSEKEMIHNSVVPNSTIVKGKGGKEKVYGIDKNKGFGGRGTSMRSSFDRSMQLAVV